MRLYRIGVVYAVGEDGRREGEGLLDDEELDPGTGGAGEMDRRSGSTCDRERWGNWNEHCAPWPVRVHRAQGSS